MSRYLVMPSPAQLGAQIVTSGLVGHWDAGNSASYPGTGTTWTDLTGNNRTGTLTNGPTYSTSNGGNIVFDGTNDFVTVTGSITVSEATFISWLYRNGSQLSFTGIMFFRAATSSGLNFYGTTHKVGYHWTDLEQSYNWDSGLVVPDAQWCMCAISVAGTEAKGYLCTSSGISSATNTLTHGSTTLSSLMLGRDPAPASRYFKGNASSFMLYNRALSSDEITQNYNATRGRFGL